MSAYVVAYQRAGGFLAAVKGPYASLEEARAHLADVVPHNGGRADQAGVFLLNDLAGPEVVAIPAPTTCTRCVRVKERMKKEFNLCEPGDGEGPSREGW